MYTLTLHCIDRKSEEVFKPVFDDIEDVIDCLESYVISRGIDVVFAITKNHKVVMTGYINKENID